MLELPHGPIMPRPPAPTAAFSSALYAVRRLDPACRQHDGSRTHLESRLAFPDADEDAEEIATPKRQFSLVEITSGLPEDSREADERAAERRLRELRAR